MKRKFVPLIATVTLTSALGLTFGSVAQAHNQGWIILPDGRCVIVAAGNVVVAPDGTFRMDLVPDRGSPGVRGQLCGQPGQLQAGEGPAAARLRLIRPLAPWSN